MNLTLPQYAASSAAVRICMETMMIKYAIIFAVISVVAGALGFTGVAAGSAGIAKVLFGLFLILAVVFIVLAALGVGATKKMLK
jgi:uncharacterized membrane protein YtjA (UPF0391 family)